jgi:hypothetical protein
LIGGRRRLAYGVVGSEVQGFSDGDQFVSEFLARYEKHSRTWWAYASTVFMFFRWLRVVHGLGFGGKELLDEHIRCRSGLSVEGRRWALRLVIGFSRDNPDLKGCSDGRKYQMFNVMKQFFDYHEAPLSSGKNVYGGHIRRKYRPRQISIEDAKRLLGYFNVRDRAILLVMLQSGMSIGDVLNKFSLMLPEVTVALKSNVQRFRVDFAERKGNGFNYFTFISRDALYELKKWLALRLHWLDGRKDPGTIFIAKPIMINDKPCLEGRPLTVLSFEVNFIRVARKMKIKDGPWSVTPHMFRKLFKTESRPPERGIDDNCVLPHNNILTLEGAKPISEAILDDWVLGHDGHFHPIQNVFSRHYSGEIIKITPRLANIAIEVTPNHPIFIVKHESPYIPPIRKFAWVQANNLKKEDLLAVKKGSFKNALKSFHDDYARFAGYYLAEGSTHGNRGITFTFGIHENELIDDVCELGHNLLGMESDVDEYPDKHLAQINFWKRGEFADIFRSLYGTNAKSKHVPFWAFQCTRAALCQLMRGLWLGDGTKGYQNFGNSHSPFMMLATASHSLMLDVFHLLIKLKYVPDIQKVLIRNDKTGGLVHGVFQQYHIRLSGKSADRFSKDIGITGLDFHGQEHRTASWMGNNYVFIPIRKVERFQYDGKVCNLQVQGSNSYFIEGVPSHNCIEFMMGHSSGIQAVGGIYDRTPELHAEVVEKEFAKLEPYVNIYSGKAAETEGIGISEEDMASLKQLLQMVKEGKIKIEL